LKPIKKSPALVTGAKSQCVWDDLYDRFPPSWNRVGQPEMVTEKNPEITGRMANGIDRARQVSIGIPV